MYLILVSVTHTLRMRGREGERGRGREGGKDGGREGGRERGREGGKKGRKILYTPELRTQP